MAFKLEIISPNWRFYVKCLSETIRTCHLWLETSTFPGLLSICKPGSLNLCHFISTCTISNIIQQLADFLNHSARCHRLDIEYLICSVWFYFFFQNMGLSFKKTEKPNKLNYLLKHGLEYYLNIMYPDPTSCSLWCQDSSSWCYSHLREFLSCWAILTIVLWVTCGNDMLSISLLDDSIFDETFSAPKRKLLDNLLVSMLLQEFEVLL